MNTEVSAENSIDSKDEKDRKKILSVESQNLIEDKPKNGKKIAFLLALGLMAGFHYVNEGVKTEIQQSIQENQLASKINEETINAIINDIKYENISTSNIISLEAKINNITDLKVSDAELILAAKKYGLYLSNFIMTGVQPAQHLDGRKVNNMFSAYHKLATTVESKINSRVGDFQDLFLFTEKNKLEQIDKDFPTSKVLNESFLKEHSNIITKDYQILKSKDTKILASNLDNFLDLIVQNQFLHYFIDSNERYVDVIYLNSLIYQEISKQNKNIFENFWSMTEEEKAAVWKLSYEDKMHNAKLHYSYAAPTWFIYSNFVSQKTKIHNSEKISVIKITGEEDTSFYAKSLAAYLKVYRVSDFKLLLGDFTNSLNKHGLPIKASSNDLSREIADLELKLLKTEIEMEKNRILGIPTIPIIP